MQLTEEEKKAKLAELQKRARENRARKDAEAAIESEKNRVRYNREMQQAQMKAEETQRVLAIEHQRKEKREAEEYKRKLLEQMEIERCERLGIKPPQKQTGP